MSSVKFVSKRFKFFSGVPVDDPGNGRYFYCAAPGNSVLYIFDSTLFTAANWNGSGWNTSPLVAQLAGTFGTIAYIGSRQQIITGNNIVDANPQSPLFNTIVGTSAYPGIKTYDWVNDYVLNCAATNFQLVDLKTGRSIYDSSKHFHNSGNGICRVGAFSEVLNCFGISHEFNGTTFVPCSLSDIDKLGRFPFHFNYFGFGQNYIFYAGNFMFRMDNSTISIFDVVKKSFLSTITVNSRGCRPGYSAKHKRFVTANIFSNQVSFFKLDSLAPDGSVVKPNPGANETGTRDIVANDDVAMLMSTSIASLNTERLHVLDMNAKTFIGWYDLPVAALSNFNAIPYLSHLLDKNQIMRWN